MPTGLGEVEVAERETDESIRQMRALSLVS